ncbi:MAG TPA: hypothetical protein VHC97_01925 [Thermoanaerobaculia bacterium]|nr:hypothetical protein [Thermoanaerobaculia bacterium]
MTRASRSLRLFAVVIVLSLMTVPIASARPVENPGIHESEGSWLGTALKWVEDALGTRRPNAPHPGRPGQAVLRQDTKTSSGGSCIDPHGYPMPCPR